MAAPGDPPAASTDLLIILLPLLIILSTLLFLLLLFVISILFLRRRRGIMLRDADGPLDLSRDDSLDIEGAFDTLESNWLESTPDEERREYRRAKGIIFVSFLRPTNRPRHQNGRLITHPTPSRPISLSLSFFLYRRRVFLPGHLNPTTNLSPLSLSIPGQKLLSSRIHPSQPPAFNQTFPYPS